MADFSREVRRILREGGCYFVRQGKGDHEIWYSPITNTTFPVDGKIVSRHFCQRRSQGRGAPESVLKGTVRRGGSATPAISHAGDFKNPDFRSYLDRKLRGSNGYKAEERVKLLKWGRLATEFGGRHELLTGVLGGGAPDMLCSRHKMRHR